MAAMEERITACGHKNVSAAHASTFEVTTDEYLTPAGDCILGIRADRAPADFDPDFAAACRDPAATITVTLAAGGSEQTVTARGHPDLTFASERSAVVRTSDYVDDRTVAVGADVAATDVERDVIDALSAGAELSVAVRVGHDGHS